MQAAEGITAVGKKIEKDKKSAQIGEHSTSK
jgi:hypothetical protein